MADDVLISDGGEHVKALANDGNEDELETSKVRREVVLVAGPANLDDLVILIHDYLMLALFHIDLVQGNV